MSRNLTITLFSHSSSRLGVLEDIFNDVNGIKVQRKLMGERVSDPLAELGQMPDAVVLDLGRDWESDLRAFAHHTAMRPPLIVIGAPGETEMMRKAMQVGARDYFTSPIVEEELIASVRQISTEARMASRIQQGRLIVLMGAKGGAGCTTVTANLATAMASGLHGAEASNVLALDMDQQFGTLNFLFDLPPNEGLALALQGLEGLDQVALEGLIQYHESGVAVLSSQADDLLALPEVRADQAQDLIAILSGLHDHIVVDVPRRLEAANLALLEMADEIILVLQQSVAHVRDTRLLLGAMRNLGISNNRIRLLINRYEKSNEIKEGDIAEAFPEHSINTVPNDWKKSSFAINNGVPMVGRWPKAPACKSLIDLAAQMPGLVETGKPRKVGVFGRR